MKIYVSNRLGVIVKRMWLFVLGPALLLLSVFIVLYHPLNSDRTLFVMGICYIPIFIAGMYNSLIPDVLLIENDKIILKGALRSISYNLNEFKEVSRKSWWNYIISFTDDKSFSFQPNYRGHWYQLSTFRQKKIEDLNNQINGIIVTILSGDIGGQK